MLIHLAIVATFCLLISGAAGFKSRIAGGSVTSISKHPYIVSIQKLGTHYCGGSIISKSIVITAAHCIPSNLDNLDIHAGTSYVINHPFAPRASKHPVEKVLVHENFRRAPAFSGWTVPVNDIALIKVRIPFEFGLKMATIPMFNASEEIPLGSIGTVSGWGRVPSEEKPIFSGVLDLNQLRSVQIPIVPKAACEGEHRRVDDNFYLKPGEICAREDGKDTCKGDSGGPLVVAGRLAGLVSWGYDCEERGSPPAIYTEVAYFRGWIDENVRRLENETIIQIDNSIVMI